MSTQKLLEIILPILSSLLVLAFIIGYVQSVNRTSYVVENDDEDEEDHI